MAEKKTREKIVNQARELFAKHGVNSTTIGDIAEAAGIGRRTVYTYFKTKDDVYLAVIGAELEWLSNKMAEVANADLREDVKVLEMIYTRLAAIREVVLRNGSLRANFFRNIFTVEKVRRNFDRKEVELFAKVLAEGAERGVFKLDDIDLSAEIIHYSLKGLEVPYILGKLGAHLDDARSRVIVANILLGALNVSVDDIPMKK